MASATQKIQLDIAVRVQGLSQAQNLNNTLRNFNQLQGQVQRNASALEITNFRQIKSWSALRDHLSEVERRYDAVFRAGVHLHQLGNQLMGISKTLIGTGMELIDVYGDYDFMLRRAAVALNTNTFWQQRLDEAIQQTAIAIGLFSPEEVAEAYYIWGAAAGVVVDSQQELNAITDIVRSTMIATAMAGGQLEANLKGIFGITSVFNLAMSDAQHVIEVLALMTERTAADFGDLTQAFSYVGPLASSIGVTFDEVAQVLGILADAGQRGSRAGRGLSMIFEGLANRSGPANKALTQLIQRTHGLGASFDDVVFPQGEFIGMTGFINEMAAAVDGLNDRERARLYSVAFTNNATRAFIPLIEEQIRLWREQAAAGEELTSIMDQQKYAVDEAGQFFATMSEMATSSINAMIGSLVNSFFPILQEIALQVWGMAGPVIDAIRSIADEIHKWMEANPEMVRLMAHILAIGSVVLGVVGAFFALAGSLILLGAGIGVVLTSLGGIIMSFLMLGSIVTGVITAVVTNFGGLRDAFTNLADAIIDMVRDLGAGLGDFKFGFQATIEEASPILESAAQGVADFVNNVAGWIRELSGNEEFMRWAGRIAAAVSILLSAMLLIRTVSSILTGFLGLLWAISRVRSFTTKLLLTATGFSALGRALKTVAPFLFESSGGLSLLAKRGLAAFGILGLAVAAFITLWETNLFGFRDILMNVINWLVTNVPAAINTVVSWIQGVIGTIGGWLSDIWSVVSPVLAAIWKPIGRLIDRGIPALMNRLGEFWNNVSPIFASIGQTAVEVFQNVLIPAWEQTTQKVGEFWNSVAPILGEFIGTMLDIITNLVEMFFAPLVENWDMLWGVIGIVLGFIFEGVIRSFEGIIYFIGPWIEAFIRIIGIGWETISGIFRAALTVIEGLIQLVFGTITNIWKTFQALARGDWDAFFAGVRNIFFGAADAILKIVSGLVEGLWTAFTGAVSFLWELITNFLRSIVNLFPDFVKDWIKAGGDIIKGLWEGISGGVNWFWTKISKWLGDLWSDILGFFGISSPSKKMASIGEDLVRGLWQGIQNLASWVRNKISGWVHDIWDNVITFWDNGSPSKRMMGVGEDIAAGFALGIARDRLAARAMDRWASGLADRAEFGAGAIASVLDDTGFGGSVNFQTDNERTIRVEIDLKSSDGSVDNLTLNQLEQSLSAGFIAAVEKMAEVTN